MLQKKLLHGKVCTCLCTAAAEGVINIYDYKYLPISLVFLHEMLNLNYNRECAVFFGCVFFSCAENSEYELLRFLPVLVSYEIQFFS